MTNFTELNKSNSGLKVIIIYNTHVWIIRS